MKRIAVVLIGLIVSGNVYARQDETPRESVLYGSLGFLMEDIVTPDIGFHVAANYQSELTKRLAWGAFISYARQNTYPDFFEDKQKLDAFLMSQRYSNINLNSHWKKIVYTAAGMKFFYAPVNTENVYVSAYLGGGFTAYYSSYHSVPEFTIDPDTGQVYSYTSQYTESTILRPFLQPGVFMNFTANQKYIIGMELNFLATSSLEGYISLSGVIGLKL